jgi:hypothetical protein
MKQMMHTGNSWKVKQDLFDYMRLYYKEQVDSNVKCYELGGGCQSDNEE